jgi:two-component system sensor histidine kinase DegS
MLEMSKECLRQAKYDMAQEEIEHALEQTRNGLSEIRAFLFNLNPTGIQEGFDLPLRRLAAQLREMRGCKLSYTLSGDLDKIASSVKIGAFKTLHQAVINAASHGATEVKVTVGYSKNTLRVHVTDNGKGFDVDQEKNAAKERGSYGLINMEDRVKMLGGKISISSVIQKGSRVSFSIPILGFE